MNIVKLTQLKPAADRAAKFQGSDHNAVTSFFVVTSIPGRGVNKHRHPYEETLIILKGDIEMSVGNELQLINEGNAIIISPNTWHAFINKSNYNALMVTIHASPQIIQEDWKEN